MANINNRSADLKLLSTNNDLAKPVSTSIAIRINNDPKIAKNIIVIK